MLKDIQKLIPCHIEKSEQGLTPVAQTLIAAIKPTTLNFI